ncbi:unnamed protein product [Moneuplotes crassus]|uniref:Protein Asterix n=2 Tax=Euplotes crassus TaxID=5936 RepID=A0AAD2D978_EUPCR|nr:unnamed protein product [Moneuplotes crassus]
MGDRKNESRVIKMSANAEERGHANEGGASELYQLGSMAAGFLAFMFRYKWGPWICMLFYLMSLANMRLENKFQQIFTSLGIVVISFVTVYVTPNRPPMPPPTVDVDEALDE